MKYEVSNIIFNHKPNEYEISHMNPFRLNKVNTSNEYCIVDDNYKQLRDLWDLGHSLKPHAFRFPDSTDAKVNCIILDFDNLSKEQYDWVKSTSESNKFCFCGGDSAGMKTYRSLGITPDRYKYKVFYEVRGDVCLCTYNDVYNAFLSAVGVFNWNRTQDEVRYVFGRWVAANNNSIYYKHDGRQKMNGVWLEHKKGDVRQDVFNKWKAGKIITIENKEFEGWILPDVAMLNNYRAQITYGVDVNQKEKYKVYSAAEMQRRCGTMSMYKSSRICDYSGLDWKQRLDSDVQDDIKIETSRLDKAMKIVERIADEETKDNRNINRKTYIPLSKSALSKRIHNFNIKDLVIDVDANNLILSWIWHNGNFRSSPAIIKSKCKNDINIICRTFTRNACEIRKHIRLDDIAVKVIKDVIMVMRQRYNRDIVSVLKKYGYWECCKRELANTMLKTFDGYENWRYKEKAKYVIEEEDPNRMNTMLECLRKYLSDRKSNKEYMAMYMELRNDYIEQNEEKLKNDVSIGYTYKRRGLKKELIERGVFEGISDINEWRNMCLNSINEDKDGYITSDDIDKWFECYKREVLRKSKTNSNKRNGKYVLMFAGKSKDEIEEMINQMKDLSKQARNDLKKRYIK